MTDPLQVLLQTVAKPARFAPNSRYQNIETAQFTQPDGRKVVYLRRRFVPPPANSRS